MQLIGEGGADHYVPCVLFCAALANRQLKRIGTYQTLLKTGIDLMDGEDHPDRSFLEAAYKEWTVLQEGVWIPLFFMPVVIMPVVTMPFITTGRCCKKVCGCLTFVCASQSEGVRCVPATVPNASAMPVQSLL